MYKPNFDTELPWPKVLDLMNELLEHEIDSAGSSGEIEYIIVELNNKTKNILCNLGINLNEVEDEFYSMEENWIDITSCIWGGIPWHYGHELYYTGKKFIVQDREKEVATKAIRHALDFLENEDFAIDGVASDVYEDMLSHLRKADTMLRGRKVEGDNS